jgi:hypothetical protein
MFDRVLGLPSVLVGFGLPDDRIHAPNEKFDVGQFRSGIRVLTRLWDDLAVSLPRRARSPEQPACRPCGSSPLTGALGTPL